MEPQRAAGNRNKLTAGRPANFQQIIDSFL